MTDKNVPDNPFEAGRAEIKKTSIQMAEEWVNGLRTSSLVALWLASLTLLTGQDLLSLLGAPIPFGSEVIDLFTDTIPLGIDESVLGIPWFLATAELVRRARRGRESKDQSS